MGSVPPAQRGAASGIRSTFQNSGAALVAQHAGDLPPVSSLFAAVLGENPVQHLLQPTGALSALPAASRQALTGKAFFPDLISGPFHHGLIVVFSAAAVLSLLAALASLLRGGREVHP
jgi:hypothetical protein